MASTNFLQHNPSAANQENDSDYAGDPFRISGVASRVPIPQPWMNKLFYQTTTFIAAMAGALAAKGFSTSDASLPALTAVLEGALVTSAGTGIVPVLIAGDGSVVYDCGLGSVLQITFAVQMSRSITSAILINPQPGQTIYFMFQNNLGAVNPTVVWPSAVKGGADIDATPATISTQTFKMFTDNAARNISGMVSSPV